MRPTNAKLIALSTTARSCQDTASRSKILFKGAGIISDSRLARPARRAEASRPRLGGDRRPPVRYESREFGIDGTSDGGENFKTDSQPRGAGASRRRPVDRRPGV